ncbi:MAG: right-handed parallel beta-helix repeat-containing protein [Planctomycetota bacterium]
MNRETVFVTLCVCATIVTSAAIVSHAGPLSPPAGPVASTAKPLGEIEPRVAINAVNTPGTIGTAFLISEPGSYYLTGNVSVTNGFASGITVISNDVTIDLNGFTLEGNGSSGDGIFANFAQPRNITVRNGTVRGFNNGIRLRTDSINGRLEDLLVENNSAIGAQVGFDFSVRDCVFRDNGTTGFSARSRLSLKDSSFISNAVTGVSGENDSTVVNCIAHSSGGDDFRFFGTTIFNNCQSVAAGLEGFDLGERCQLINCTAFDSFFDGFSAQRSVFQNCVTNGCGADGFDAELCTLSNCNATENLGVGFRLSNCTLLGSLAQENVGGGIVASGSNISGCTVSNNSSMAAALPGISAMGTCFVHRNIVFDNGGEGIVATGGGNSIVQNSLRGDSAVNNSGSSTVADGLITNPWANFVN